LTGVARNKPDICTVRLFCGPGRSERAGAMDALMREHWGHALLITPTQAYATHRREVLMLDGNLPGAWGQPVRSFTDFVQWLLEREGRPVRRIDDFGRRLLLEQCLDRLSSEGRLAEVGTGTENAGLVTHLLRVVAGLKQAALEPEAFRVRVMGRSDQSPFDGLVADVYAAYQEALKDSGQYDVPGLYWETYERCRAGKPRALEGLEALFFDGFDDFTPSEFRLIEGLVPHVSLLALGLNCDLRPGRRDLYTLSIATAEGIRQKFDIMAESFDPPPPRRYSEYAGDNIFWRDRPSLPEGLQADLIVVTCSDRLHEVETIGRRVKRLIRDEGVPPNGIAVVFRNLSGVAGALRSVFAEFGIPVRILTRPRVSDSALGTFLNRLFEATGTWARETVLDVLTSAWWGLDAPVAAAAPLLARTAQIIAGQEEWTRRLEAFAARLERPDSEAAKPIPGAAKLARALLAEIARLQQLTDVLPEQGTSAVLAAALDGLLDTLGIEDTLAAYPDPVLAENERRVLAAVRQLLETLADSGTNESIPREAFLEGFARGLEESSYPWAGGAPGVVCMDAASARNLRFDHVFFGGLVEGVTPMPPALSAIYSDRDLERLRKAGVALESKREHGARERLLFHHVLESAQQRLTLSWSLQKEGGRETTPSPFLVDVQDLFQRVDGVVEPPPRSDSFLPRFEDIAGERDLRNAAFFYPGARQAYANAFPALEAATAIEDARQDASPFGKHDGMLSDPGLVDGVRQRFGPSHQFSVDQLETYGECPFSFFAQRILGIAETETPVAEFDPRVRGIILHNVLQRFHQHFIGCPAGSLPPAEAEQVMLRFVAAAFEDHGRRSVTAPPGVLAMEQRRLETVLRRYLGIERSIPDDPWEPRHFEVAFGEVRGPKDDPCCRADPFILETEAGPVRFAGRIDRIDMANASARILDYKSSAPPVKKEIDAGRSIQLTVYAWALEQHLLPGTQCAEAHFVQVGRRLSKGNPYREAPWTENEDIVRQAVADAVNGIRAGVFPPVPATAAACTYCAHAHACRHETARIERKGGHDRADANPENGE
jgi:ATP-dependent helicase/DNAse subunit B